MALTTGQSPLGQKAPGFDLPATDGGSYTLANVAGENGTVVAFICNHCPYVKAVADRMAADAKALADLGVGFAAICANDAENYPADSFPNMKAFAEKYGFAFPYLQDETQEVARAYDAACTPEFYGLDADGVVRYHGRLDAGRTEPLPEGSPRELVEAMTAIASGGEAPAEQFAAVGCGIKWKS